MSLLQEIGIETWRAIYLAAPFLLLGLATAGFLHVLLPESLVARWMGGGGLSGVSRAALIGIPLPVCSCGVVPIATELRRKGASVPATTSFLITTPESSLDSILLTWGLMGPLMAVVRPVAAFVTAIIAGILAIAETGRGGDSGCPVHPQESTGEGGQTGLTESGPGETQQALRSWWRALRAPRAKDSGETPVRVPGLYRVLVAPALRYAFGALLSDLAFWLLLGLVAAGVIGAVVPDDLSRFGLGGGLRPLLLALAIGVPMYLCASASTPVAAAFLAKGLSPGAALVFLLAGPATNAASMLMLGNLFGRRFLGPYLFSIAVGALLCGWVFDLALGAAGLSVAGRLGEASTNAYGPLGWVFAIVLLALTVWRLIRGAAREGVRDLTKNLDRVERILGRESRHEPRQPEARRRTRRRLLWGTLAAGSAGYLVSGFQAVPPDAQGFGFLFSKLTRPGLPPGLHWMPPSPFGRLEVKRVGYPRKGDIGFRTELGLLARRRELRFESPPGAWHSPVAAMNADPARAGYLTGDENLVEMSFSVHYMVSDPVAYFYRVDRAHGIVLLTAEARARELVAALLLDELLTTSRGGLERSILESTQARLDEMQIGVHIHSVHIVDVHPPGEGVYAFRDVSSAREDRETRIHRARANQAQIVPRARGNAAAERLAAGAYADAKKRMAVGQSAAFIDRVESLTTHKEVLTHLLWLESAERVLAGREKFLVPPGTGGRSITLWREEKTVSPEKER